MSEVDFDGMFTPVEDEDELAAILAGTRGRGDYRTILEAFIKSGHKMVKIPLDRGLLEGKKAATVKSGFENVKTAKNPLEGADKVLIRKREDDVFLVNQAA